MAILLQRAGYEATLEAEEADLVMVNTCGFIAAAREESLETLQAIAAGLRKEQRLVATGCWAQREPEVLTQAVPQIDAVLGSRSWHSIARLASEVLHSPHASSLTLIETKDFPMPEQVDAPGYVVSGASAFLKIADGCSRSCAFCAIPAIRGSHVSRSVEAVLSDARALQQQGVLEINLIAQDVTYYGHDRGERDGLADLLERLVKAAPDVPWIRLLYAYPGYITERLVDVMVANPQVLPYIDIPLQHAHPDVLRRMRRPSDVDWVRRTVDALRSRLPDIALRTTFIVGFPGETDAEFSALYDFLNEMRFDRVGVFIYSHETGTPAAHMVDDVPNDLKEHRREALMLLQQKLSQERNGDFVGRTLTVLLEGAGDGLSVGRSYRDAPEIDGVVLVDEELPQDQLVEVEITEALAYDLVGKVSR